MPVTMGSRLRRVSLGRSFTVLWSANAASNLADGLAFVSIPLLATSLTDDPRWVAGLSTLYALVRLLVALPIGVLVDRVDRRMILVVANLLRGGAVLALAIYVQLGAGGLVLLYVAFIAKTGAAAAIAKRNPPSGGQAHRGSPAIASSEGWP